VYLPLAYEKPSLNPTTENQNPQTTNPPLQSPLQKHYRGLINSQ